MPDVHLDLEIQADLDRAWAAVEDVESYPAVMSSVRRTTVLASRPPTWRHTAWSIVLKGSILEWEEHEHIDRAARVISFDQVTGDMDVFRGAWALSEAAPGLTRVRLDITFEIGIPLLADMLNPVAQRSLRDNCRDMLLGVQRAALAARG